MAMFTSEQKQLSRQLIQTTTGFTVSLSLRSIMLHTRARLSEFSFLQPSEENFKLSFQFAKSNFRFHRYLDVNDLNVRRSVKG